MATLSECSQSFHLAQQKCQPQKNVFLEETFQGDSQQIQKESESSISQDWNCNIFFTSHVDSVI